MTPLAIFFNWIVGELYANAQWYARVHWGVNPSQADQPSLILSADDTETATMSDTVQNENSAHSAGSANAPTSVSVPVAHGSVRAEPSRGGWNDEREELLRQMWDDGNSASQIGAALGAGFTRNAIIGKAHRLGLAGRPNMIGKRAIEPVSVAGLEAAIRVKPYRSKFQFNPTARQLPAPIPRAAEEPVPEAAPAPAIRCEPVTIMDLKEWQCRWPLGDPLQFEDFRYCAGPKSTPHGPYCSRHSKIAFIPITPKRVDARPFYR